MFRKLYKEANDDIKPDRALIGKIFEKAERKPRKSFYAYRYGTVLAAALVLVVFAVSFDYFGTLDKEPVVTENSNVYKDKTSTDEAETKKEPAVEKKAKAGETVKAKNEVKKAEEGPMPKAMPTENTVVAAEKKESPVVSSENEKPDINEGAAKNRENMALDTADITAKTNQSDFSAYSGEEQDVAVTTEVSEEEKIVSSGGGGGSGSSIMMRKMPETVIWSREKYIEYIGIDIPKLLQVPSDMKLFEEAEFYLRTDGGEVVSDEVNFIYIGDEGRTICVSTGKISEISSLAKENPDAEKSDSGVYLLIEKETFNAYMEKGDTKIAISGSGVSREEIDELIASLK